MFKKIFKIIIIIFSTLVIIFLLIAFLINYFAGLNGKVRDGEYFCKDKKYAIGKAFNNNNIYFCDISIKGKCIGHIVGYFKDKNENLYLKYDLGEFLGKSEQEINNILNVDNPDGAPYRIFNGDYSESNKYYAKTYGDIKYFLKLNYNDCNLNFYSNNELDKIDESDKKIFLDLKNSNLNQ